MKKYIVILAIGFLVGFAGRSDARGGYYRGGYGYHGGYAYRGGYCGPHAYYCPPRPCVAYNPYYYGRVWVPGYWGWNRWHRRMWFGGYWR